MCKEKYRIPYAFNNSRTLLFIVISEKQIIKSTCLMGMGIVSSLVTQAKEKSFLFSVPLLYR